MEKKTRIPTQKRALEKYDKILDAAYKLFNEKGYYNTTTADISKEANVATGSVYAYFEDKKEIYIRIIEKFNKKFDYPTHKFWVENKNKEFNNAKVVKELFKMFIKIMVDYHDFSKIFHDEMEALTLLDEDIAAIRKEQDKLRKDKVREIFKTLCLPFNSEEEEKIFYHYSFFLVDDVCHKIVFDEELKDVDLCIERCVNMLCGLFEDCTNYKDKMKE
ncbi:fatty acid metabolism regulator protein [Clostridium saccharobutylicum]|uniref:TetR/AcrR family transcriptional regulator n=1 Tax=Clostridium saccharobutylicum TaxID=169679 RepID=UPI000983E101|nr:TetR/AcrR family transcriptional regulator [Clostridium saccharobutylicum]AQS08884.1 fatty acid metabolism regulator protein [Clostridium saccharobutylicum]MBC2437677.1 TetR/AcrR family transcriptional regulator [Clostridium saccharobutylicum]NSB90082.1 AcrR family transcriptional regulator [Clostridium saccharobutylicum]NYC28767.1 AcrR family transcriptional regulator [Clostridium saccharobutylicum]OOM17922.1 fatty acid metabolism regulator protein [Clostridium saccharobutylicum]